MKFERPRTQRGFTLVELLVVLATLALLAAMLLPALASSKLRTHLSQCMDNQRQLALGWQMYADDHNDKLCLMGDSNNTYNWLIRPSNLSPPPSSIGITNAQQAQIAFDEAGYQRGGLYRYAPNPRIIHCPGDTRINQTNSTPYISYAGSHALGTNGQTSFALATASQILHPSDRWLWIEENDPRSVGPVNGWTLWENLGPWDWNATVNLQAVAAGDYASCRWFDGGATFHFNSDVFSFADGHVGSYIWKSFSSVGFASDSSTSKANTSPYISGTGNSAPPYDPDFVYVFGKLATVYNP